MKICPGYTILFTSAIIICSSKITSAQVADTLHLHPVEIIESRSVTFSTGLNVLTIDSLTLDNSKQYFLADLLPFSTAVFIKSYGMGGSATLSVRGTEARHTSILWNGFNINSSSLGVTDVANISGVTSETIRLITGGSGAVNGNSSLGGTLILESPAPAFTKHFSANAVLDAGSFDSGNLLLQGKYGNSTIGGRTVLIANKAENNFSFKNTAKRNDPEEHQSNAATSSYGFIQDINIKTGLKSYLTSGVWYQVNQREIPPLMTSPLSEAFQHDSILRIFAGMNFVGDNSKLRIKTAFFNEFQYYDDETYNLDLEYHVTNYLASADYTYRVSKYFLLNAGTEITYSVADIKEYNNEKSRYIYSAFASGLIYPFRGTEITAGIRTTVTGTTDPPLAPSLGIRIQLADSLIYLKATGGRHFSVPSMNDLYWIPGGNINLKPENAWSYDAGIVLLENRRNLPCVKITWYQSLVKNWIKWEPDHSGIYSPNNLREVSTSGVELNSTSGFSVRKINLSVSLNYTYSRSVLNKTYSESAYELTGKQLTYIPENRLGSILNIEYNLTSVNLNVSYTGLRYTTADNSQSLPGFWLFNARAEQKIRCGHKTTTGVFAEINNITNTEYQVIALRPTPGRWFRFGIKLLFKNNQ